MCLWSIDKKVKEKRQDGAGIGYKVFSKRGKRICGIYHGEDYGLEEWLDEFDYSDRLTKNTSGKLKALEKKIYYPYGFHIFLRRKDAVDYAESNHCRDKYPVVKRVLFKNVTARGFDMNNQPTVVARKMLIKRR